MYTARDRPAIARDRPGMTRAKWQNWENTTLYCSIFFLQKKIFSLPPVCVYKECLDISTQSFKENYISKVTATGLRIWIEVYAIFNIKKNIVTLFSSKNIFFNKKKDVTFCQWE